MHGGSSGPLTILAAMACFCVYSLLRGLCISSGTIAWNLGHLHFAKSEDAEVYMGLHVSLTGLRGLLLPGLGMLMYRSMGWWVWVVSVGFSLIALAAFRLLDELERTALAAGPQNGDATASSVCRLSFRRRRAGAVVDWLAGCWNRPVEEMPTWTIWISFARFGPSTPVARDHRRSGQGLGGIPKQGRCKVAGPPAGLLRAVSRPPDPPHRAGGDRGLSQCGRRAPANPLQSGRPPAPVPQRDDRDGRQDHGRAARVAGEQSGRARAGRLARADGAVGGGIQEKAETLLVSFVFTQDTGGGD